ncbi:hypothetical protein [Sphingomicrobium lutaoense]|uniref:Uncharacterized protein n=1 Tax=Sphingomicrobium lutaoense TaxID=515949 RepID=A0A839YWE8_9SPHN|nr:hypothetical protein [Sphingomicrobium lutaoense]MBB3763519.1 hypothetical protein [Sphingomicrobium lutaoense]
MSPGLVKDLCGAHLNDYLNYALVVREAALNAVLKWRHAAKEIVILAYATGCESMPLFGVHNSERSIGSPSLLNSRYAQWLATKCNARLELTSAPIRDLWHRRHFRSVLLLLASAWLLLRYAVRLLNAAPAARGAESHTPLLIVRALHQFRFARGLLRESGHLSLCLVPQYSQGNVKTLVDRARTLPRKGFIMVPGLSDWFGALFAAIAMRWRLGRELSRTRTPPDLVGLAIEMRHAHIGLFHVALIDRVAKRGGRDLVNFEMIGAMAGLEALAARRAGLRLSSVQTALISDAPLAIFPFSDEFYSDSPEMACLCERLGHVRMGEVKFVGSPYPVQPIRPLPPDCDLLFCTQPDDRSANLRILKALIPLAKNGGRRLAVRPHPRDDMTFYRAALEAAGITVIVDRDELSNSLEKYPLIVLKTSSLAKDALGAGAHIVFCHFTDRDRSLSADYLDSARATGLVANDEAQLAELIANPNSLSSRTGVLRSSVLPELSIRDLADVLGKDGR